MMLYRRIVGDMFSSIWTNLDEDDIVETFMAIRKHKFEKQK
jgi:hypothetical protein